jgi:O-antigen ligase
MSSPRHHDVGTELRPAEGSPPFPGRAAAETHAALFWAAMAFIVVTFVRPQDILGVLKVLRPGIPVTFVLLVASLPLIPRQVANSVTARLMFAFLAVIVIGGIVTVNQYWWFQTVWIHAVTTVFFAVSMPVLFRTPAQRDRILALFLFAFDFVAIWVLTHHGVGQGGFLGDENDAGVALGIGFCFAALFVPSASGATRKVVWVGSALLCAAAIVATNSRGGFLGLVVAVIAVAWFSRRVVLVLAMSCAIAVVAYPFLPAGYVDKRLASANDPNDPTRAERLYGWHRGWDMFLDHPILGVGAANYSWRVGEYDSTEKAIEERQNRRSLGGRAAHSMYFQLLPETGLAGTVLYIVLLIRSLRIGIRWRRGPPNLPMNAKDHAMARVAAAGLVVLSVSGAFVSVLFYPYFWMLVGFAECVREKQLAATGATVDKNRRGKRSLPREGVDSSTG